MRRAIWVVLLGVLGGCGGSDPPEELSVCRRACEKTRACGLARVCLDAACEKDKAALAAEDNCPTLESYTPCVDPAFKAVSQQTLSCTLSVYTCKCL